MTRHAAADVRRAQILEAALACFAEKGLAARMDDVVAASGLSKGALYFHFRSKDELFMGLFEAYEAAIFAAWDRLDALPPLEALRRQGEEVLDQLLEMRGMAAVWTEFFRHPEARARMARVYRAARKRIASTLERVPQHGSTRAVDAPALAGALTAVVEGLVLQALVDPTYDPMPAWQAAWSTLAS